MKDFSHYFGISFGLFQGPGIALIAIFGGDFEFWEVFYLFGWPTTFILISLSPLPCMSVVDLRQVHFSGWRVRV